MVSQQLECPVCFIRFDTERRARQSVTCPSCDQTFNAPGEDELATEAAPAVQAEEAEEEAVGEAAEEEAPDGNEEPAVSEAAPKSDEAEEETPQGDELPNGEPKEGVADEGAEAGEAPETGKPEEDEPPAPPEPTTPGALELLGELSTAYRTERLQSVIDGPRSRAQLAGLLLLAVAVLGLLAATASAVKWSSYDSPWDDEATASLHGSVIDVDGNPLEDVRVAASGQQTFTDGEGRYFLHNLTAGELKVTFFSPAYRTHDVWIDLRPAGTNLLNAELTEGDGHDVEDQRSHVLRPWPPTQALAAVMAVMSLLALLGSAAALLERHFRLALFGAVAGILSWGFLLGSLFSLAALLLLLGDRERFEA